MKYNIGQSLRMEEIRRTEKRIRYNTMNSRIKRIGGINSKSLGTFGYILHPIVFLHRLMFSITYFPYM